MKSKKKWSNLINLLLLPVVLVVLGLVLLLNPDAASVLAAKLLGWCLIVGGVISTIVTLTGWPLNRISRLLTTIVLLALGGFLLSHPLSLSAGLGKLLGLILLIQGGRGLWETYRLKSSFHPFLSNLWLALATLVIGVLMMVFPMSASRLVFRLCGIVLIIVGAVNLITRLRIYHALEGPDDPNIIDAAP